METGRRGSPNPEEGSRHIFRELAGRATRREIKVSYLKMTAPKVAI